MRDLVDRSDCGQAVFSHDRQHRYLLTRNLPGGSGICCFILLNPSRADAFTNDPTIARCLGFATRWQFHTMRVVNLFSLMSSDPKVLAQSAEPIRARNDEYLLEAVTSADRVVAGWGRHGWLHGRSSDIRLLLKNARIASMTFGITKNGEPRHPLYLSYSSVLLPFE